MDKFIVLGDYKNYLLTNFLIRQMTHTKLFNLVCVYVQKGYLQYLQVFTKGVCV